jgi:spermidine/putrescine transport system permease protein
MVLPGLSTAFAIAFILAVGDFVVPAMVGGTQGLMIGNVVADQFKGIGSNWPLGAALAFLILVLVVAVYLAVTRLIRLATRW